MPETNEQIWSLQRTARLHDAKDAAHFRLLRMRELLHAHARGLRRASGGLLVATILTIIVVGTGARAEERAGAHPPAPAPRRSAQGTPTDETLTGSADHERIDGRGGDDVILAGAGDDVVLGSMGADVLQGGDGADVLWAGPGRDVLIGGAGDDELHASQADRARDRLHCGAGRDTAWVVERNGRLEDQSFGCERVYVIEVRTQPR